MKWGVLIMGILVGIGATGTVQDTDRHNRLGWALLTAVFFAFALAFALDPR